MIWAAVRGALYVGLGIAEAVVDTYDRGKRLLRVFTGQKRQDASESHPLTYRDVSHQQSQIRAATTALSPSPRRSTILPPRQ